MPGAIEVSELAKQFGERTVVEGLTFSVPPGEVFGLLGPNGAGKTTTVRMLAGLLRPTRGRGAVLGVPLTAGEPLRAQVGLLTEQPGLYDRLSARDNLRFFMRLNGVESAKTWARTERYLKLFGLLERLDDPTGSFSKGMRQKLAIIRTLVHEPRVLFLDEPTSGLDPESARSVRDGVAELATEGRTVVLCSHNLAEVERLCTRVAVVKGRLLAVSPVKALRREGLMLEVTVEGDATLAAPALQALPRPPEWLAEGRVLKVMLRSDEEAPEVLKALVLAGVRVFAASQSARPLEEVYLELMKETAP